MELDQELCDKVHDYIMRRMSIISSDALAEEGRSQIVAYITDNTLRYLADRDMLKDGGK